MTLNSLISSSETQTLNRQLFLTFFQRGKDFDAKLAEDLSKDHSFTIARAAFKRNFVSSQNLYDTEVAHGFLQLLLMDRLLYYQNRSRQSSGLYSLPISTSTHSLAKPDKITEPYVKVCESWTEHIKHFVRAWDSQKPLELSYASHNAIRSRSVVSSLADGLTRSQGRSRLAKVEGNFCLAALGIKALLLVSFFSSMLYGNMFLRFTSPRLKIIRWKRRVWHISLRTSKYHIPKTLCSRSFPYPISEEVGLPPDSDLYNYQDPEFLRAIYSVVSFSSLVLLMDQTLGRNQHTRIAMYKLLEVSISYYTYVVHPSDEQLGMHI